MGSRDVNTFLNFIFFLVKMYREVHYHEDVKVSSTAIYSHGNTDIRGRNATRCDRPTFIRTKLD